MPSKRILKRDGKKDSKRVPKRSVKKGTLFE